MIKAAFCDDDDTVLKELQSLLEEYRREPKFLHTSKTNLVFPIPESPVTNVTSEFEICPFKSLNSFSRPMSVNSNGWYDRTGK